MFEKLIDLFIEFLEFFRCAIIVDQYQKGVVLRFGKFHRVMEPGLQLLLPFYIENTVIERTVPRVREFATQTLVTADDKPVVAGIIVALQIFDIKKATLEINEVWEAVDNACQATLAEHVMAEDYEAVRTESFAKALTTACRMKAEPYGIEIMSVRLYEFGPTRTYRLIGSK